MTSITEPKIRFSTVVHALDRTPKSLRHWLTTGRLGLMDTSGRGWVTYSLVDVAMLAVTGKLVDFGIKVDEASRQARDVVLNPLFSAPVEVLQRRKELGEDGINDVFRGKILLSWPDAEHAFGWRTELRDRGDLSLPAAAALVVSLDEVVATALRRTREHLETEDSSA